MSALNLFGGPGGTCLGVRRALGIDPLGIEWDEAACDTRRAAGLPTLQADVAELDPIEFGPVELLLGSPPCQAWSMAGKRGGEADKGLVYQLTDRIANGLDADELADDSLWEDPRSRLVMEPLRWALALRPRWIALEQVPPVLDYWRHIAEILRSEGWNVWTGILEAERYGVPQTRERAILMADREAQPHPPTPTHQRYIPGEPARHDVTLEGEILPWVSMAEALGWASDGPPVLQAAGERKDRGESLRDYRHPNQPSKTVDGKARSWQIGFPRRDDTGTSEDGYRERDWRDEDEPAFAVTEKARSAVKRPAPEGGWIVARRTANGYEVLGNDRPAPTVKPMGGPRGGSPRFDDLVLIREEVVKDRDFVPTAEVGTVRWMNAYGDGAPIELRDTGNTRGQGEVTTEGRNRDADEPAPPLTTRADQMKWTENPPAPTIVTNRRSDKGMLVGRQLPEGEGRNVGGKNWEADRPATTIAGDPRVFPPGGHIAHDGRDNSQMVGRSQDAVRVTLQEAAILQGFPPDYPFQGSRTKQFQQVGNAVPPPLAQAILSALVSEMETPKRLAA